MSQRSARIEVGIMKLSTYLNQYPLSPVYYLFDRSGSQKRLAGSLTSDLGRGYIIDGGAKYIYRLDLKIGANETWKQDASDGINFVL